MTNLATTGSIFKPKASLKEIEMNRKLALLYDIYNRELMYNKGEKDPRSNPCVQVIKEYIDDLERDIRFIRL